MNRAERRRQGLEKEKTITYKHSEFKRVVNEKADKVIEKALLDVTTDVVNKTTLAIILVLRDKLGYGKVRAERFIKDYNEVFSDINAGLIDYDDLKSVIEEIGANI